MNKNFWLTAVFALVFVLCQSLVSSNGKINESLIDENYSECIHKVDLGDMGEDDDMRNKDGKSDKSDKDDKSDDDLDDDNSKDKKSNEDDESIYGNIMPPEIESEIVAGLRVNVFAAKKKFKLGESIIIYTVIRNKSDKLIKLKTDFDNKSQLCFFDYSYTDGQGINVQRFCRWKPVQITNSISPNAVFCYENDYKATLNKPKRIGNIKFTITIAKEIENNKYDYIESNTIEFELVN